MNEPTYTGNRRVVLDHAHAFMAGVTWAMDHLGASPAETLQAAMRAGQLHRWDASYMTEFGLGVSTLTEAVGDCVRRHTRETIESDGGGAA